MLNSSNEDKVSNISTTKEQKVKIADKNIDKEESEEKIAQNDTDLKFDELVKKLREQDSESETKIETSPKNDDITPKIIEPKKEKEEVKKELPKTKEIKKPKISITSASSTLTSKPVIKAAAKPAVKTHKKPQIAKKHISSSSVKSGYYIQVGASLKPTPNRFLVNKIKNSGYRYSIYPIIVKGRRFYKILIGPYISKTKALEKISRVRATINPKAYIYFLRK